jgi:CHAT domain-containing protein/tetratricopeptide (TPR) repeat protein
LNLAALAGALVQTAIGDSASAKESLESLLAKSPDAPELQVELAVSLASKGLYEQAASQLDLAVAKFTSRGDQKAVARAYVRVASGFSSDSSPKGQTLQVRYLEFGRRIYHELKAQVEEAATLNALGEYYLKLSQGSTAIAMLDEAYQLLQNSGHSAILAQTLSDLGNAYQHQKDFERALDFHKKAAAVYHELNNPGLEAFCLQNLARDYSAMNEPDESLSSLLEAKRVAARGPALSQYFASRQLAEFYREQGSFEKALAAIRESAEIAKQAGDLTNCAYSALAIAELDTLIGDWDDAVRESETALKLFEQSGDKNGEGSAWGTLTSVYSERSSPLRDFNKAQECYAKAQELGYGENLQLDLVETYLWTGKYAEAVKIANDIVQRCTKDGNAECQAYALLSLSEAQRMSGEIGLGRASLNKAARLVSDSQELYLHGLFLYGEARQLTSEQKFDDALASYKKLIAMIETVKGRLSTQEQRALAENYEFMYDELVSLLYSMSTREPGNQFRFASDSLEYAEKNKARQFVESWGRTFVDRMRRSLPAGIQESERTLFAERDRIVAQLNVSKVTGESLTGEQKEHLQAELLSVQAGISGFLKQLRSAAPQYASVAYPDDIQIAALPLRKGEAFVEFKLTDDAAFAWIVQNRDGRGNELVSFYKVPFARKWFLERITLLRKGLNSGHPETINWKASEDIFKALFPGEVSTVITKSQNTVFIPDDVLFALPFQLYSPNASKGEFIFLPTPSVYYPSAEALRFARRGAQRSNWQEAFLGLADPITSPNDNRFEAAGATASSITGASGPRGETSDSSVIPSADPSKLEARGFSFERLPGTALEVRTIADLLKKTNTPIEVRVGIDATKTELLDTDLSKFRFLHFATHGVLPVDTGISEPALVLSYDGLAPSHMFLTMSEVLGLKLRAESVVLSACNTGTGSISKAEGVMSLGRAFLAAGSSSVIVSLWQVADESTALFMEEFYRNVLEGKSKGVALALARASLFAQGYRRPFFWAPFIVIGE